MKPHPLCLLIFALATTALAPASVQAYYNPSTGRWLNRDPIAEPGFQIIRTVALGTAEATQLYRGLQGPPYLSNGNEPLAHIDPLGLDVYKLQIKSQHKCCGVPIDHRYIIGATGTNANYSYKLHLQIVPGTTTACGACAKGWVSYELIHKPLDRAISDEKELGAKGVKKVETSPQTDAQLNEEAAEAGGDVLPSPYYIFILQDCGTLANDWLKHARELEKNKKPSPVPPSPDSP